MDLENLIRKIVREVGFSENDIEEITMDLTNMTYSKFIIDLSKDKKYKNELETMADLSKQKDYPNLTKKIAELTKQNDFADKLKKAFYEVIKDWLPDVSSSLSEEKRQEIINKLELFSQRTV